MSPLLQNVAMIECDEDKNFCVRVVRWAVSERHVAIDRMSLNVNCYWKKLYPVQEDVQKIIMI